MNTPTLKDLILAARDVEHEANVFAITPFNYHAATPAGLATRGRYDGYHTGANVQHDRLSPALILAVEALESWECFCGKPGEPDEDVKCAYCKVLTRIREILEGEKK